MKLTRFLKDKSIALSAGFIAFMNSGSASAQTNDLKGVTTSLNEQMENLPALFTSASYIIGIGFTIAGLFKLKEFVDDPGQGSMKDALIRLGVGALLILLPFAIEVSQSTIGAGDATVVDDFGELDLSGNISGN